MLKGYLHVWVGWNLHKENSCWKQISLPSRQAFLPCQLVQGKTDALVDDGVALDVEGVLAEGAHSLP